MNSVRFGRPGERVVQRVVLQPLDRAAVVGRVADRALERVGVERLLRQLVDGAGVACVHAAAPLGVAEHDHLRPRVLLEQLRG